MRGRMDGELYGDDELVFYDNNLTPDDVARVSGAENSRERTRQQHRQRVLHQTHFN